MGTIREAALGPSGVADLIYAVTGIDGDRVLNFQNRQGVTDQEIVEMANSAIGMMNENILARYGGMVYTTTDTHARYRQGEATKRKTPKRTEFGVTDGVRSSNIGHMLRLGDYIDKLEWSQQYLRDAYRSQIESDLSIIKDSWYTRVTEEIWGRALTNTEIPDGSGFDVPWAIGSGVNVPYIPSQWQNKSFTDAHTHFKAQAGNTAANLKSLLDAMVIELRHHGMTGRLQLTVSEADVDAWASIDGFVALVPAGFTVVTGGSSSFTVSAGESNGMPGELFGHYSSKTRGVIELRYDESIPTGYCFLTKSMGENNPENGLAIRLHPDLPFGLTPDVRVTSSRQPVMDFIELKATHGIGVNRRLNGVAGQFNSATFVNPTF